MLTLAHLSDVHLSPIPGVRLADLASKRMLGYVNWQRNRKSHHRRDVLDALVSDMMAQRPDHIAVTGDIINLGLPGEFAHAREWLAGLGHADAVSVVPGNHDAYVSVPPNEGIGQWRTHMTTDEGARKYLPGGADGFPFIRIRGGTALIGLSSATPTAPLLATGSLGGKQRKALAFALKSLADDGYFRVVLIHHPPLPGQAPLLKALRDAEKLQAILEEHGAELVLHGHNHTRNLTLHHANGRTIPILGVPSASSGEPGHKPLAQYHLIRINPGGPACEVSVRGLTSEHKTVHEIGHHVLH